MSFEGPKRDKLREILKKWDNDCRVVLPSDGDVKFSVKLQLCDYEFDGAEELTANESLVIQILLNCITIAVKTIAHADKFAIDKGKVADKVKNSTLVKALELINVAIGPETSSTDFGAASINALAA